MAEVVGSISVVASINTAGYDSGKSKIIKGNQDLEKSAKDTSSGFSGAWTGAIAGVVASMTSKLMNVIGSLTGDMTDLYDASIKFPKVLQTMGATGDDASAAFADMKKYADLTIYSLQDMTNTYGSLYGIVGKDSGKLVTALGGISTLAANASQAMSSWSLQLTQMVAKPTVAWQDFRILLEQNPGAIAKIAEAMGKTTSQIISDVNNGTLSTQDFLKALQEVGNDDSLQKAATSSDTFKNSTGQLQASIASAGAKMLDAFGPAIIAAINGVSKAFDTVSTNVSNFINWINKAGLAQDTIKSIAAAILLVVAALTAWNVITKIITVSQAALNIVSILYSAYTNAIASGLGRATAAQVAMNAAMNANLFGIIITLIAALVAGLVWFFTQTETGKQIWEGFTKFLGESITSIGEWFKGLWDGIKSIFSNVGSWFKGIFQGAWDGIKSVFGGVGSFFRGVWDTIVGIFGEIGTAVGDAISGAFKGVINGVLKGAIGIINGFIKAINVAIDLVNKIPGVNIGKLKTLDVPQLANGGIVSSPTLAMIGEGRESEAVIPLSKLDEMINGDNGPRIENHIGTINIASDVDADRFLRRLTNDQEIVSSGLVPQQKYMGALS